MQALPRWPQPARGGARPGAQQGGPRHTHHPARLQCSCVHEPPTLPLQAKPSAVDGVLTAPAAPADAPATAPAGSEACEPAAVKAGVELPEEVEEQADQQQQPETEQEAQAQQQEAQQPDEQQAKEAAEQQEKQQQEEGEEKRSLQKPRPIHRENSFGLVSNDSLQVGAGAAACGQPADTKGVAGRAHWPRPLAGVPVPAGGGAGAVLCPRGCAGGGGAAAQGAGGG